MNAAEEKYLKLVPLQERAAFLKAVQKVARALGVPASWLLAVMYQESGVNPSAFNPDGGGGGLIGFMPQTALELGTTVPALRSMTRTDQLQYVQKFYERKNQRFKSFSDFYLSTFYPYAIGRPDWYVIGIEKGMQYARRVAKSNPVFDLDKDGVIKLAEFRRYVNEKFPEVTGPSRKRLFILGAVLIVVIIAIVLLVILSRGLLF